MRREPHEIAHPFIAHLEREECALRASLDVLRAVRAALLRGDLEALNALREPQERVAAETVRMRADRESLRTRLAASLGLAPQRVSLSTLVAHVPTDDREHLRRVGEGVRRLAEEVDGLVRCNAALLAHLLRFTRSFLFNLTGGGETVGRYGPDGTHRQASFGSLLSTRG